MKFSSLYKITSETLMQTHNIKKEMHLINSSSWNQKMMMEKLENSNLYERNEL